MSKERKIQKDKVQSVKECKNLKKKNKNTKCIFGSNGKNTKKCNFVFFCKNTKKYECNFSKISNTKKNTKQKFQKCKIQKKYEPKISKYKIHRKYKVKNEPESQPHVHFGNQETNCKKNTKPTSCIFQTLQF
jgi:hypothetical protein